MEIVSQVPDINLHRFSIHSNKMVSTAISDFYSVHSQTLCTLWHAAGERYFLLPSCVILAFPFLNLNLVLY